MQVALKLNDWEKVYHKGNMYELGGCLLQGKALVNINVGNCWLEVGCKSFEHYCREVLGIGKSTAHNKMQMFETLNDYYEKHPELKDTAPTRIVRLLPHLTEENRDELLAMAHDVPSAKDFENNISNLNGKPGTDECTDHVWVIIKRCKICGLKVRAEGD
jgi:hypothetical protein